MRIREIIELDEAQKDIRKLSKKYSSFEKDYRRFCLAVKDEELFEKRIFRASVVHSNTSCKKKAFYKCKYFRCEELKSTKDFRIIYFIKEDVLYIVEFFF